MAPFSKCHYIQCLRGRKNFSAPSVPKNTLYTLYVAFYCIFRPLFSKNRENFLKMAPQAHFFQNFTQIYHVWRLKGFKISLKQDKNFKIPLYLVLSGFKTQLYLVLSGSQNLLIMANKNTGPDSCQSLCEYLAEGHSKRRFESEGMVAGEYSY